MEKKGFLTDLLQEISPQDLALDDFMVNTAIKVREARLKIGYTQQQAADKCGISQVMVSKLESGDYNPSIESLWKYINALGGRMEITVCAPLNNNEGIVLESSVIKFERKEECFQREQTSFMASEQNKWRAI